MTYIVVTRNPKTKKLAVLRGEDEEIVEYPTEDEAYNAAESNGCCRSWGAEIVPVDRP